VVLIVCHVLSPRKYVVLLAVPVARRAVGTVPEDKLEALSAVKEAPDPATDVAVTVPETVTLPADDAVITSSVVAPEFPTPSRTVPSGLLG
jgi:hypothetical protein